MSRTLQSSSLMRSAMMPSTISSVTSAPVFMACLACVGVHVRVGAHVRVLRSSVGRVTLACGVQTLNYRYTTHVKLRPGGRVAP